MKHVYNFSWEEIITIITLMSQKAHLANAKRKWKVITNLKIKPYFWELPGPHHCSTPELKMQYCQCCVATSVVYDGIDIYRNCQGLIQSLQMSAKLIQCCSKVLSRKIIRALSWNLSPYYLHSYTHPTTKIMSGFVSEALIQKKRTHFLDSATL